MEDLFTVVTWPESQELLEIEGFEENSILIYDGPLYDQYGDAAYLVSLDFLMQNLKEMNKVYGVYFAYSKYEVGFEEDNPDIPKYPSKLAKVKVYSNARDQLEAYANTMCAASQMITANSRKEFDKKVKEMKENFNNPEWISKNIEPYV